MTFLGRPFALPFPWASQYNSIGGTFQCTQHWWHNRDQWWRCFAAWKLLNLLFYQNYGEMSSWGPHAESCNTHWCLSTISKLINLIINICHQKASLENTSMNFCITDKLWSWSLGYFNLRGKPCLVNSHSCYPANKYFLKRSSKTQKCSYLYPYVSLYITSPRNVSLFLTVGVMTASSRGNVEPLGTEMLNGIHTCSPTTLMAKSVHDCRTIFSKSQILPAPT